LKSECGQIFHQIFLTRAIAFQSKNATISVSAGRRIGILLSKRVGGGRGGSCGKDMSEVKGRFNPCKCGNIKFEERG
jgi:hypothetical protein